ncbi:MAG: PhnD/SsuA/transferrin family substrate-binding protein [bacterium]
MKTTGSEKKTIIRHSFITRIALLIISAIILAASSDCFAAAVSDQLSFDLNLPPSMLGQGSSEIFRAFQELRTVFRNDMDIDLSIQVTDSWNEVINRLETDKTDFAWMPPYYYFRARANNPKSKIRPLAIYQSKGTTASPTCIYVKPNGIRKLEDLLATRVAFPDEAGWAVLNHIFIHDPVMAANQIDPSRFFVKFRILPRESSALAIRFNAVDAIVLEPLYMEYLPPKDQDKNKIMKLVCSEPLANTVIVYRKNLDPFMKETLELFLTSMHSDPTFSQFRHFFKTTNGQWTSANEKALVSWKKIYTESVKNGWDKSYKALPK